jgi:hypothetical protein
VIALLPFWIFPALFVLGCLALIAWNPKSSWRRVGAYGLLAYFVSFAIGTLGILESRGSTSGIGFLFLPTIALGPGLLGALLGIFQQRRLRLKPHLGRRRIHEIGMTLSALAIAAILGFQTLQWYETGKLNQARDRETERQRQAIRSNSLRIEQLLGAHPGEEARLISREAAGVEDRTLLIPLARSPFAPTDLLDRLSRSPDLGVALTAVRNPNISQEALIRIYREHTYPGYFFSTLADHPRTPPWMLAELYEKRNQNIGIAPALSRNPNTPFEIRKQLHDSNPSVR